jgi:hypothetical protein
MLLEDKVATIYGAGGAIGSAVARAFAREGAKVFLSGRTLSSVEATARDIIAAGGDAEAAQVDALDEQAVDDQIAAIVRKTGKIDVSFNAITAVPQTGTQGVPLADLAVERFLAPITAYLRSHFLTARAAARRMLEKRTGVILMHTPEPARLGLPLVGGVWAPPGQRWRRSIGACRQSSRLTGSGRCASVLPAFPRLTPSTLSTACMPRPSGSRASSSDPWSRGSLTGSAPARSPRSPRPRCSSHRTREVA